MMNDENLKRITYFLFGVVLFMCCWLAIITGYVFGLCSDVIAMTETTPSEVTSVTEPSEEYFPEETTIETTTPETIPDETTPETEDTTHTDTIIPEETETIPEETKPYIDPYEVEMLACVIFQEAGWDRSCDDCRRRVADVVLNRVADDRFPNNIHDVLMQKNQYGRYYWTGIVWPDYASDPNEKADVERAYRIAREVLSGQHSDLYGKGYVWQATFKQGTDNIYCCGHYYGR